MTLSGSSRPPAAGYRHIVSWDLDLSLRGSLAVPGRDTVTLSVGLKRWIRHLVVAKDPYSSGHLADIRRQVALSLRIRHRTSARKPAISIVGGIASGRGAPCGVCFGRMGSETWEMLDAISAGWKWPVISKETQPDHIHLLRKTGRSGPVTRR